MAEKKQYRRVAEIAPIDEVFPPLKKPQDWLGKELVLLHFEVTEGDMGEYYILECLDPESGETFNFSSGAMALKAQLKAINPQTDLPLAFKFLQSGRTYYMG